MSESSVLELAGVERTFRQAGQPLKILRGASLRLSAGEMVALLGPSGAGKSTLLHIAGLLERPDGGDVIIDGRSAGAMSDRQRTFMRSRHLGFVYQFHHLQGDFDALENVMMPQLLAGVSRAMARRRAREVLERVALLDRAGHRPARLSGGEQQRVAIARAISNSPRVLLADEPTGNLDPHTAGEVFDYLRQMLREARLAALVATHNFDLARQMDRVVRLEEGLLVAASV